MSVLAHPLLADENLAPAVVEGLRQRGCDVRTVFDEALVGAEDAAILERASQTGRIVVTRDSDFGELAVREGRGFIGILYLRPGHISPAAVMELIDALEAVEAEAAPPFVAVVSRTADGVRVRVKTLPSAG